MEREQDEYDLLMQQIDHLKRSVCPNQYQYTHEFLDLAMSAARREAPPLIRSSDDDDDEDECDAGARRVADPLIVH